MKKSKALRYYTGKSDDFDGWMMSGALPKAEMFDLGREIKKALGTEDVEIAYQYNPRNQSTMWTFKAQDVNPNVASRIASIIESYGLELNGKVDTYIHQDGNVEFIAFVKTGDYRADEQHKWADKSYKATEEGIFDIDKVVITYSDNAVMKKLPKKFKSVTQASDYISKTLHPVPPKSGYYKTDFEVWLKDGTNEAWYKGRFDYNWENLSLYVWMFDYISYYYTHGSGSREENAEQELEKALKQLDHIK